MKCRAHSGSGLQRFSIALVAAMGLAALLPFVGGCGQSAKSAPVTADVNTNQAVAPTTTPADGTPSPDETVPTDTADQQLENAPGTVISTPTGTTPSSYNPQIGEVVKLAQAGVGDSILMAYVTNSPTAFQLSSDDVVYLNDLGVPQTVINAMLQRDQSLNATVAQAPAQTADQSGYVNVTPAPLPQSTDQNAQEVPDTTAPMEAATPPLNPPADAVDDAEQAPNGSYSYFYDSLSPYGNWINVNGYGPCWQPTTLALNPGWQPYCDGGHWVYTDCGWCWVSDYSWGWAPFHYGRWFHSTRFGWCWAPDTVWGPAWVSWRYNGNYCGWAPLPPAACYRPGFGFTFLGQSVGFNFTFGLSANSFVFVPLNHFHDRALSRSRVAHREVDTIFRSTTLNNQMIRGPNNTLINRGVPVERVAAASGTEIRAVHIRTDVTAPGTAQVGRDGRSLSIYRPALPTARPAAKQRLAGEGVQRDANFSLQARIDEAKARPVVTRETPSESRPVNSNPTMTPSRTFTREANPQNNVPSQPGWSSTPNRVGTAGQWPNYQRNTPAENNRQLVMPQQSAPRYQAPQQWQQRPAVQQPNYSAPRQEQFRQQQFPQEQVRQKQFQQEQPRQEIAPRNYDAPRTSESRSAAPAQSAPSHQESSQNNNSGNNNGNGNGGGGGGGGGGRGH